MRVTRSMTRNSAPNKKQEHKKEEKKVSIPTKRDPNVEFITKEELASRNIEKRRYINLINATTHENMIRSHDSFKDDEIDEHIAEKRIYAVVPDGYSWTSRRIYFGGDCYYIEKNRL
jgi:hypothetical protein